MDIDKVIEILREAKKKSSCPPGFKLIDGVCRPIEQDRGDRDRPTFTGPEISKDGLIKGYTHVLDRASGSRESGALNSIRMQQIEDQYGAAMSSKIGEINQKYRNRGVQVKLIDSAEVNRLKNIYGQSRVDKDFTQDKDGNYYRIVATSPKAGELIQDAAIAAGDILKNANMINVVQNVLSNEEFDSLILMDGDGEDRPEEVKSIIEKIIEDPDSSVVAKRVKRSEGLIFSLFYLFLNIGQY